jgi:small subunit ribosomal protein MRP21
MLSGRTVLIRKGEGVAQAYARLQSILRINNVRKELKLVERHEKKGEKRRRLRSERWRRKFADEVCVSLVHELPRNIDKYTIGEEES